MVEKIELSVMIILALLSIRVILNILNNTEYIKLQVIISLMLIFLIGFVGFIDLNFIFYDFHLNKLNYMFIVPWLMTINTLLLINLIISLFNHYLWSGIIYKNAKKVPLILVKMLNFLIYFFGIVLSMGEFFNQPISQYLAFSGATAAVLGYLGRDFVSQVIGGIAISLAKNINKNDFIKLDNGIRGTVIDFDWRSVKLKEITGAHIIIPNTQISNSYIFNYSSSPNNFTDKDKFYYPGYIKTEKMIQLLLETLHDLDKGEYSENYVVNRHANYYSLTYYFPSNKKDIFRNRSNIKELLSYKLQKNELYLDAYFTMKLEKNTFSNIMSKEEMIKILDDCEIIKSLNKKDEKHIQKDIIMLEKDPKSIINQKMMSDNILLMIKGSFIIEVIFKSWQKSIKINVDTSNIFYVEKSILEGKDIDVIIHVKVPSLVGLIPINNLSIFTSYEKVNNRIKLFNDRIISEYEKVSIKHSKKSSSKFLKLLNKIL